MNVSPHTGDGDAGESEDLCSGSPIPNQLSSTLVFNRSRLNTPEQGWIDALALLSRRELATLELVSRRLAVMIATHCHQDHIIDRLDIPPLYAGANTASDTKEERSRWEITRCGAYSTIHAILDDLPTAAPHVIFREVTFLEAISARERIFLANSKRSFTNASVDIYYLR